MEYYINDTNIVNYTGTKNTCTTRECINTNNIEYATNPMAIDCNATIDNTMNIISSKLSIGVNDDLSIDFNGTCESCGKSVIFEHKNKTICFDCLYDQSKHIKKDKCMLCENKTLVFYWNSKSKIEHDKERKICLDCIFDSSEHYNIKKLAKENTNLS